MKSRLKPMYFAVVVQRTNGESIHNSPIRVHRFLVCLCYLQLNLLKVLKIMLYVCATNFCTKETTIYIKELRNVATYLILAEANMVSKSGS
jgi:hypothetical protein